MNSILKFLDGNTIFKQLFKYFGVGGLSALVEWAIFNCFLFLNFHYLIAVLISFVVATGINYSLCKQFVFIFSKHVVYKEASLIYFVSIVGLMLNIILMWIMVDLIVINPFLSKVLATGIVFFWNFLSRKIWVFGDGLVHTASQKEKIIKS